MALFDDMFDDIPLHHSLRIPPLIDPLPFLPASLDRPSPLEPNARVNANIDNETAKLTGRRKALAEAKPLGDAESNDLWPLQESSRNDLRPIQKSPRKRQKLYDHEHIADFVQLPKPMSTTKEDKPPPFQPVAILNELHEPPPSAALFPPITPGTTPDHQAWKVGSETLAKSLIEGNSASAKKAAMKPGKDDGPPARRVYLRPERVKWSEAEISQLVKGVAIYGMGKWKKILRHPEFDFHEARTAVDLKDRFRTCFPQKDSVKHRTFANELLDASDCAPDQGLTTRSPLGTKDPSPPVVRKRRKRQVARSPGPNRKRARRKPWSKEEDDALREGYLLHGFSWTAIANDPSLHLENRSGGQVRDRFRLKYAHLYGGEGEQSLKTASKETAASEDTKEDFSSSHLQSTKSQSMTKIIVNNHEGDQDPLDDQSDSEGRTSDEDELEPLGPLGPKRSTVGAIKPPAAASFDITNILNDEDEDNRPSASLRYDGWSENVTLPPLLLWEDMATRPIFELE